MARASSRWIVFAAVALAFAAAQMQQFETTFDSLQLDPDNPPPMRATLVDEHGKTIEVDAVAEPVNDASTMELGEDGTLSPRQQAIQMRWQKMLFDYLVDNAKCAPELLGLRKLSKEEYEEKAKTGRVISEACDNELDRLASEFQGKVQRGEITQPPLDADGNEIAHGFSSTAPKGKGKGKGNSKGGSAATDGVTVTVDSGVSTGSSSGDAEGAKNGKNVKAKGQTKKATVDASGAGHVGAHLEL